MSNENEIQDFTFTVPEGVNLTLANQTFTPLSIRHYDSSSKRQWSLDFRSRPTMNIILTGDSPTRDELVEAIAASMLPGVMISVCEIIIDYVQRNSPKE